MILHRRSCKYRLCRWQQRAALVQECRRFLEARRGRRWNGFVALYASRGLRLCCSQARKQTIYRPQHPARSGRSVPPLQVELWSVLVGAMDDLVREREQGRRSKAAQQLGEESFSKRIHFSSGELT